MTKNAPGNAGDFNYAERAFRDRALDRLISLPKDQQPAVLSLAFNSTYSHVVLEAFDIFQCLPPKHKTKQLWQDAVEGMTRLVLDQATSSIALEKIGGLQPKKRALFCIRLLGCKPIYAMAIGFDLFFALPPKFQESEQLLSALEKCASALFASANHASAGEKTKRMEEQILSSESPKIRRRLAPAFFPANPKCNSKGANIEITLNGMRLLASLPANLMDAVLADIACASIINLGLVNMGYAYQDAFFSSLKKLPPPRRIPFILAGLESGDNNAIITSLAICSKLPQEFQTDRLWLAASINTGKMMQQSFGYSLREFNERICLFPEKFRPAVLFQSIEPQMESLTSTPGEYSYRDKYAAWQKEALSLITGLQGEFISDGLAGSFARIYRAFAKNASDYDIFNAMSKSSKIRDHPLLRAERAAFEEMERKKKLELEKAEQKRIENEDKARLKELMERHCANLSDFKIDASTMPDFCKLYSMLDEKMKGEVDGNIVVFFVLRPIKEVTAFVSCAIAISDKSEAWPLLIKLLETTGAYGKARLDCDDLALSARAIANEPEGSPRFEQFSRAVGTLAASKRVEGFFSLEQRLSSKSEKELSPGELALLKAIRLNPGAMQLEGKQVLNRKALAAVTPPAAGAQQKQPLSN